MRLEDNIWKYYVYRVLASLFFFQPVFILFLLDVGLTMFEVMVLQSVFTGSVLVFSILTGLFADTYGRRNALILSELLFVVTWLMFGFGSHFIHFGIAEMLGGISTALFLNAGSSFIYDTLHSLRNEKMFQKVMGRANLVNYVLFAIGSLIGGYIAVYSLRLPLILSAVFPFISAFICFSFVEPKHAHRVSANFLHFKEAYAVVKNNSYLIMVITVSAITSGVFFVMFLFFQPFFKIIGMNEVAIGKAYLLLFLAAGFGAFIAHNFKKFLSDTQVIVMAIMVYLASLLGMLFIRSLIAVVFVVFLSISVGLFEVAVDDFVNKRSTKQHRATVLSFKTSLNFLAAALLSPLFGFLFDTSGITVVLGILSGMMAFSLVIVFCFVLILGGDANET